MAYLVQTIKTKTYFLGPYKDNKPEPRITTVVRKNKKRAIQCMDAACEIFEYECGEPNPRVVTRLLDTEMAKVLVSVRFFEGFELIEELRITIMES